MDTSRSRRKPPALRAGDTVGIVAPASNVKREALQAGCAQLVAMGYKPFYLDSIFDHDLYFAGTLERRESEMEEMFRREEVRAIVCARGGYGSNYLLSRLNVAEIAAHPKILVGYSDVTSLLTYLTDAAGMVTFHGPMVAKDFAHAGGIDADSWKAALGGIAAWELDPPALSGVRSLVNGVAEGMLYGGCLSMLVASLGTPYEIQTAGTILFIEDVATKPYQIDRMLMQLKLAGKLSLVRGLIFGEMLDCAQRRDQGEGQPHKPQGYTLEEVILRIVEDLRVPVAFGLRSGHVTRGNITLPIGVRAQLAIETNGVSLRFLEAATL